MAEFCKDCAPKYGFEDDFTDVGGICEGCGQVFADKKSTFVKVLEWIKSLFK